MKRGNLVIYDPITGKIWSQTGEAEGEVLSHEIPIGLPYIEIPFGSMSNQYLKSIDISDPENPVPVFEPIERTQTPEERIAELEALLAAK